jgi:hypothetical protein
MGYNGPMRTALILLALVVVLGFVSIAQGECVGDLLSDKTIVVSGHTIGFRDFGFRWSLAGNGMDDFVSTEMYLGSLGSFEVPFTATQGLVGFCLIVVGLLALVTTLTFRWKRKRAV